ncbi:prickle-like 4 [Crotalus adamanteus]|uniref:Prickle-like 4 n=1 Tax=Crotalus adamanteus TaxID=8729 RepID=A0AAW1BR36_CROAD
MGRGGRSAPLWLKVSRLGEGKLAAEFLTVPPRAEPESGEKQEHQLQRGLCHSLILDSHFLFRMSQPSHIWAQREKSPCSRTVTTLLPASSSDSDSGCALEDYPGPTTEFPPSEPVLQSISSCSSAVVPAAIHNQLRIKILLYQLPPQDCNEKYCPFIGEQERKQLRIFAAWRRQESLGQGVLRHLPLTAHEYLCRNCDKNIIRGHQGVYASKLGEQCWWHPTCFVCHICQQPLIDLIYFHRNEKIFCGRHHAEFFHPRCASCDQLIFTSECVEAEGMRWHEEHFCCLECDLPLRIQQYVMKGGQPCCCACFESLYADICQACGEIVGLNSKQIILQGQHWHSKDSCFCCSLCRKALLVARIPLTLLSSLLHPLTPPQFQELETAALTALLKPPELKEMAVGKGEVHL